MLFVLSCSFVFATNTADDSTNTVSEEESLADADEEEINSDLILYGTDIEITKPVNGNVVAYGTNVTVSATIYGDLIVLASSLEVTENTVIAGNILAYASEFTFSGIVSDIYAASSDFTLTESGIIYRSLDLYANTVNIYGQIYRDANLFVSELNFADDPDDTLIKGNINYWSTSEFDITGLHVSGSITYHEVSSEELERSLLTTVSNIFATLFLSLVFVLLTLWISPKLPERFGMMIKNNSFKAFGIGALIFVAVVLVSIFLFFCTVGLGSLIIFCLVAFLILGLTLSTTVFSMAIAQLISNRLKTPSKVPFVLISLLVMVVFSLLKYIDYVGVVLNIIVSLIGLGMIGMNFYQRKTLYTVDKNNK